jgi:glycosyltransferase involved in cell wall biosynthesis
MRYSVIITGYNCEKYAAACIQSVLNQKYHDVEILVYDDASTDKTFDIVSGFKGTFVHRTEKNTGAAYGRVLLSRIATGDVVCFLGLDDMLRPDAIEIVDRAYRAGAKATYGSWQGVPNGPVFIAEPYSDDVWENKSFRTASWKATLLNTFRRDLVLSVPEELLKIDGKWIDNCTDLAISFPCLEMCEKHEVVVIKEPIYLYRSSHGNTTLKRLGRAHKSAIRQALRKMPKQNQRQ